MHPSASKPCLVVVQGRGVHDLSFIGPAGSGSGMQWMWWGGWNPWGENMIYVSGGFPHLISHYIYIIYIIYEHIYCWWYTYPSENMSSSVGMMTFPTEWKNNPNVPKHQQLMNICWIYHDKVEWIMKTSLKFVTPYVWICWATATTQQHLRLRLCACRRGGRTVCPRDQSPQVVGVLPDARLNPVSMCGWLNKIACTIKHQVYHHISSNTIWYLLVHHMIFKWIDIIGIL